MKFSRKARLGLGVVMVLAMISAGVVVWQSGGYAKTRITAYFDNTNGLYVGDDVMILGVRVGSVEKVEPQPRDAKVTFVVDSEYKVPADANALIFSPTLVSARAIQLTPAYTSGPTISNDAVIPRERTAVPVEYDDLRAQLEKLTRALQPTQPGGVSTLGAFINTAAGNLRGQGGNIRQALVQVSQAFSILGDHSDDVFGTIKNLNTLVTALKSSTDLMRDLNGNLATVTGLLANDPNEIGNAVSDLNDVLDSAQQFLAENTEAVGTTTDRAASISRTLADSIGDIKQALHIAPNAFQNFVNIYQPAQQTLTGALAVNQFANPLQFICSAIQAASRMGAEQSAKLCVQYLAPIMKNRQYNFPPLGMNPIVGATARPNEVTFSEDWLRPISEAGRVRDFYEGPLPSAAPGNTPAVAPGPDVPLAAEAPAAGTGPTTAGATATATATDPTAGLPGLMLPPGGNP
ncbi:MCE family protein [Mycolicibacterium fluoranthenivorans]|uniref:MCE family protein n=1 Tax=Mycolicibacterium fluoranthenivorans TaxID=258505 RepID=A0A7G8PGD0_9MYCO|nr:MCE family protein [Mycolicibacterium fluoranthenivorans]QNJ93396.1 MCE family protein [Mycolicibacterium fluoranthenivorans]